MKDVIGFDRESFERKAALTVLEIWWMTPPPDNEFDPYFNSLPGPTLALLPIVLQSQYVVELANRKHAAHVAGVDRKT